MADSDKISLKDYWNRLACHDWFYEYSDDHGVWRRGSNEESTLRSIARQGEAYQALYDGFREHHFGPLYGRPATEKPPRPE